jgi:hypothetical protein
VNQLLKNMAGRWYRVYMLAHSVFAELRFWLMLVVSVVLPVGVYGVLLAKRAVSRVAALLLGFTLAAIAGLDVFVLQRLAAAARGTPSLIDDAVFLSEMSIALCLFPAMFGGIGVNVISHVLVRHLVEAEARFSAEHPRT